MSVERIYYEKIQKLEQQNKKLQKEIDNLTLPFKSIDGKDSKSIIDKDGKPNYEVINEIETNRKIVEKLKKFGDNKGTDKEWAFDQIYKELLAGETKE